MQTDCFIVLYLRWTVAHTTLVRAGPAFLSSEPLCNIVMQHVILPVLMYMIGCKVSKQSAPPHGSHLSEQKGKAALHQMRRGHVFNTHQINEDTLFLYCRVQK